MELYLMQHGEAQPAEVDPARPLTDKGRAEVQRVAARAAPLGLPLDGVYHSGILRAQQTAEIVAGALGGGLAVEARGGLAPLDEVEPVARWLIEEHLQGRRRGLLLVGHLPFLSRLVGRLVTGNEATEVLEFRMGGLVKLVGRPHSDRFVVAWALPPELA
ncbi:MAG TPA: phosphohistidine phosphatase SixA [Chloroflexota bacterium]|nr:phosphohistidine phosphatase SixA [Chloroflexota bacterium]HZU07145.1 phosphohistidine phosphatase SixA [Chloroflexota bacterium]